MASLLDLFAIGFKSEGLQDFAKNLKTTESKLDKAEKKVSTLEKRLEELEKEGKKDTDEFQRLSAQLTVANADVKRFGDEIKVMQGRSEYQLLKLKKNFTSLMKTVGLLASVGVAVRQSLVFYEQAEQLDMLAQKSNIAVESLHRLSIATQKTGGTTEGTASTVEQFTSKEFKEKALKVGVSVSKDNPEQTLENIAAKMEKLKTDVDKWELAKSLGLDEGTTRLLVQGVERYREELKRANKYKLYTKEDIERMKDYQQVQQDIRQGVQTIQAVIARLLLPSLTAIAKGLRAITDFAAKHEGGVKIAAIFIGIAAALSVLKMAIWAVNAGLLKMLFNPVVATIAAWALAITAIIVIIQDFITWLHGGESALSGLWNTGKQVFDWLKEKAVDFGNTIKGLWDLIPEPLKKLIGLSNPITGIFTAVNTGKEMLNKANNNKLNSVTPDAISNSYQTQALTENNNNNTKTLTENRNKAVNVNIGTINTQAQNGKELASELSTITEMDNGFVA